MLGEPGPPRGAGASAPPDAAAASSRSALCSTAQEREIHLDPSIDHPGQIAFKTLHEVTHDILPWQRELGYADDDATLSPATRSAVRVAGEHRRRRAPLPARPVRGHGPRVRDRPRRRVRPGETFGCSRRAGASSLRRDSPGRPSPPSSSISRPGAGSSPIAAEKSCSRALRGAVRPRHLVAVGPALAAVHVPRGCATARMTQRHRQGPGRPARREQHLPDDSRSRSSPTPTTC